MNPYQNLYIYYFSGTGNALSAARLIKENGDNEKLDTSIISIEKLEDFKQAQPDGKSLIAFTYPTHGFAPPWLMMKFLWRFPKINNADVLFVNTKAGAKMWKFYIPGMTGLAQWLAVFIFLFKGYRVVGSLPLDMPHSWTSFFPPNTDKAAAQMTARCHRIVHKMCSKVFSGKKYFRYTVWTQLWFDIAVSWIVPLYVFIGRFFLAKTLFSSYKCNNCRICEEYCPVNAIEIRNGMPYWKITCESCMRCMNICPKRSIQSWITRICIISYVLILFGLAFTNLNMYWLLLIVCILFFPFYWFFIKFVHIKLINILFTYTSLTRYWKRHVAEGIKLKDFRTGKQD
ncbi:MAG: EFR1 family ferrodoxin [Bacteroidales bacterium]|nr:EFR1 family ferrodoxin [Bacteroidales bacterium]